MAVTSDKKTKRAQNNQFTEDPSSIEAIIYNRQTGARKSMVAGHHHIPIPTSSGFVTDASNAPVALPTKGTLLVVYNKSGTVQALTLGDSSAMAALAAGNTDSNGNLGIPCAPNAFTYINTFDRQWIKTDSNNLIVMIGQDDTEIRVG
jgi:hypothetical protein